MTDRVVMRWKQPQISATILSSLNITNIVTDQYLRHIVLWQCREILGTVHLHLHTSQSSRLQIELIGFAHNEILTK